MRPVTEIDIIAVARVFYGVNSLACGANVANVTVFSRGGNFLVPLGFSAIMLAPFVCFPADFGASRLFCGNVLHIVSDSGYRLLLGISTSRVYATFAVGESVFFTPWVVTFFFAQVVRSNFAVFKGFSAQTAANTANKAIHSLSLACCVVHKVSVGDFFNVTVYMLLIGIYQARNDKIRKTCRFKVNIVAVGRRCEFLYRVVALDVIGDVTVRLKRFRHGDFDLAARLHLFAALGKGNVEYGNACAVIRLVDHRHSRLALLAVRRMMYAAQRRAAFKHAVRGNAAFGSQFAYFSVFIAASD